MDPLLTDAQRRLCRQCIWTPSDFAAWIGGGMTRKEALRRLKQIDRECGGKLLTRTGGRKPEYTFSAPRLSRLRPELFAPTDVKATEAAVARLAELLGEVAAEQRRQAQITGETTRALREMKAQHRLRRKHVRHVNDMC